MHHVFYQAAGGIVVRGHDMLILKKADKDEHVLPKGHVEPGETLEAAALRTTREETGYFHLLRVLGGREHQARHLYPARPGRDMRQNLFSDEIVMKLYG